MDFFLTQMKGIKSMILQERSTSQCPWQAGPSYIARKMDPARRAEEGKAAAASINSPQANGSAPSIDKSLIELLNKYPCKDEPSCSEQNSPNVTLINDQSLAKKSNGSIRSAPPQRSGGHGLCIFYWFLVTSIGGLIAFSMWLSVQISFRNELITSQRAGLGQKQPFSFDDIFNSSFQPRSFSVDWVRGEDAYTFTNEYGDLDLYNITSNTTTMLAHVDLLDQYSMYWISSDLNFVLLAYNVQNLWRHSFYARYAIYDINSEEIIDFPNSDDLQNTNLQFAVWSPSGNALTFAVGNNLYYQASPDSEAVQLTTSGQEKTFFNGVSDWLYEEEILASASAVWWSPDSRYIAYGVFNCTNVPMFRFPYYGPKTDVYGDIIEIAYPKSGDLTPGRNTIAQIKIMDTQDLTAPHLDIPPPEEFQNRDHYFLTVSWRDTSSLGIAWANRVQNATVHSICSISGVLPSIDCTKNFEREVSGGWVDILPTLNFVQDGQYYLSIQPRIIGMQGRWKHVTKISAPLDGEGVIDYLTGSTVEVKSISGVDSSTGEIYYISTDDNPGNRHLYKTDLEGSNPECLSCNIPNCTYFSASFSDTGKYYVLGCRGPRVPIYWLKHTKSSYEMVLENNSDIAANLATKELPRVEMRRVPIGGGYSAYAKILIPTVADQNPDIKLNLMVETYGGPSSQAVDSRYSIGYETYLASTHNVVYAFIDGRGTASRGEDFKHLLYKRMATYEMEDQLLGGEWLKQNLGFIDPDRNAAIWGWSYGGFLTSHVLANESNVFQCGISGAALIDRRYYDTAHSERYMGYATPDDNQAGYERTDITNKVQHFVGKNFLIVHGTADDNVHFASSAQFVKALTEAEVQFRFQLYTDLNHYFLGRSRHLYQLFTEFLLNDCWRDGEELARVRRENRVMQANLKLHGVPDNRKVKNT